MKLKTKKLRKHLKLLYESEAITIIQDTKKLTLNIYKDSKLVDTCDYVEDKNFMTDLLDYVYNAYNIELNVCSDCGKIIDSGYVIDNDWILEYYCSDECLHKHYTAKKYNQMYNEETAYYTEWN